MREDWDARARAKAFHYIATGKEEWTPEEFFNSGEVTVRQYILNDMENICQGKAPEKMRVLEIGCGAGRITRALAGVFGEVHAVDVSGQMLAQARKWLADRPNIHLHQNSGVDLSVLGRLKFDFAFSYLVFQHVPDREIIENYVHEVGRRLRPFRLFKFQVQGSSAVSPVEDDTWVGVGFAENDVIEMAERCGFEARYRHGMDDQYFWLWYFKKPTPWQARMRRFHERLGEVATSARQRVTRQA